MTPNAAYATPVPAPAAVRDTSSILFGPLLWLQGVYYLATGVWPILNVESFQAVTGGKTDHLITGRESDHWMIMTVAVLVTAIGLALLVAAIRRSRATEMIVLAVACCIGLIAIDVIYVVRGVLLPIYLVDAGFQSAFLTGWLLTAARRNPAPDRIVLR
jgi:hypothetical protein